MQNLTLVSRKHPDPDEYDDTSFYFGIFANIRQPSPSALPSASEGTFLEYSHQTSIESPSCLSSDFTHWSSVGRECEVLSL